MTEVCFHFVHVSVGHLSRLYVCVCRPGWFRPGARVQGADPGGGGGPGRAVRQSGDVQPQRQRAGDGGDRQHPQHAQT